MKKNYDLPVIPIFFAIDDNYVPLLAVALESMKENSSRQYQYQIYILNNGICEKYKEMIKTYEDENYRINYVDLNERLKTLNLHVRDYYTTTIYYRLFIADIFPEYDKALYLDADITILGDIADLYNYDISNYYVGAIADDVVSSFDEFKYYTKQTLGVEGSKYFNSGILVMNLKKFRDELVFSQFIKMLNQVKYIIAPDQDYLNIICQDKVLYIEQAWNTSPVSKQIVPEDEIKLIHYKLTAKPWHYEDLRLAKYFWDYAKKTVFYDRIKEVLSNYTDADKANDQQTEINLLQKSVEEADKAKAYFEKYGKLQHE